MSSLPDPFPQKIRAAAAALIFNNSVFAKMYATYFAAFALAFREPFFLPMNSRTATIRITAMGRVIITLGMKPAIR